VNATCRSCPAEVLWLTNQRTGRPAPIDATPDTGGNVEVDDAQRTYRVLGGQALEQARAGGRPLRTSHLATCPARTEWKQRR
jgi:hypothetical protein